jgi:hypothetical protein
MTNDSNTDNAKSQGRGRSNSLPSHVVDYLKSWLMSPDHISHPYPTEKEKVQMVAETRIELKRLNNWFVNNRIRYWKPRMEALQRQQQTPLIVAEHSIDVAHAIDIAPTSYSEPSATRFQHPVVSPHSQKRTVVPVHHVSDASTSVNESENSGDDSSLGESMPSYLESNVVSSKTETQRRSVPMKASIVTPRKRGRAEETLPSPRSKYSKTDAELWRKACCLTSARLHDERLPSLDEAACLFGFSGSQ